MATVTGANLIAGILDAQGVSLSALVERALAARLQSMIDANVASDVGFATVLAGIQGLRASVSGAASPLVALRDAVTSVRTSIENDTPGGSLLAELAATRSQVNRTTDAIATPQTPYLNTLLSGDYWENQAVVTYSFNTSMPAIYRGDTALTDAWTTLNAAEIALVRGTFVELNALLDVRFTEASGSTGDIRFNVVSMDQNTAGFAYLPGGGALGGDVWLSLESRTEKGYYSQFGYGGMVITHEIGHALGLDHPFERPYILPAALDNTAYTVMSYTADQNDLIYSYVYQSGTMSSVVHSAYPAGYSLFDIQALQAVYGANTSTRTGNDVYTVDTAKGEHLTIWDAGGIDMIDASTATGRSVVDLRGGTLSSINLQTTQMLIDTAVSSLVAQGASLNGATSFVTRFINSNNVAERLYDGTHNLGIVQGAVIEDLRTGRGNDEVWDNAVDNHIHTGAGDDVIHLGAGGFDTVDGGTGTDTVRFSVARQAVQRELLDDGSWLVVGENFAAQLISIERLQFTDGTLQLNQERLQFVEAPFSEVMLSEVKLSEALPSQVALSDELWMA